MHRDLKPANIKVTPEGVVKVLDFGLAKAVAGNAAPPDVTHAPTSTGGTRQGVILGTPAYMSPDQSRGLGVDKRTDVWAFGCIVYELLTGRAAFARETITDTLAAVVEREPSWSALPATTPAPIRQLLRRCLDKDPKRRLRDIGDARIEIEERLSGTSRAAADTEIVDPRRRLVRVPWSIAVIASLATLIAFGAMTWYVRLARQVQTRPPRISRMTITSGTAALTSGRSLAITPDSTRVIYVGNNRLFVRPLDQLDATAIVTTVVPVLWVFVSPDGQWVGFVEGSTIKKVALTGGPAVTIAELGRPSFGVT